MDEQVEREMQRLRQNGVLELVSFETLDLQSHFKAAFNNCRSLPLHFDGIKCDQNLLASHIFGLAVTRSM